MIDDLPTYELTLPAEGIWFPKLMAEAGLCKSNGEARRLIQGGGAYLKWAIPQSEVEKNTNIKQNEGWN